MADKKITDLTLRSNVNDDVQVPIDDGVQTYRTTGPQWQNYIYARQNAPIDALNYSLSASVASSALTILLKDAAGNNPGSSNPVKIAFRSTTLTDGKPVVETVTAPLSTVISSGSTAGHANGVPGELHIYALNNGGTIELAWSGSKIWNEDVLQSTTAEGGAGAADDGNTLYSTTARTGKAIRYLGRMISTQTTAGTWASVPVQIDSSIRTKSVLQLGIGVFDVGFTWAAGSSMADLTAGTTGTFTQRFQKGIVLAPEGSGLPGVEFTPDSKFGVYRIKASVAGYSNMNYPTGPNRNAAIFLQITDGSGNIIADPICDYRNQFQGGYYSGAYRSMDLEGYFEPKSTSLQIVKIQAFYGGSDGIAGGISTTTGCSALIFNVERIG